MQRIIPLIALCALLISLSTTSAFCVGTTAGTIISTTCTTNYLASTTSKSISASTSVTVAKTAGVTILAGTAPQSIQPGQSYYVLLTVTNTGNTSDSITLSGSSSKSWGVSVIRDDNGDGIHQATEITVIAGTGSIAADANYKCFVKVTIPSSATAGDIITVTAASTVDSATTRKTTISFPVPTAHNISFTQAPAVNPTSVITGGTTQCSATAIDSLGDTVKYAWSDGGAGGAFSPSASMQNPVYTAINTTNAAKTVNMTCTATCSTNNSITKSASVALTVKTSASLPGDFDADGTVGASDITLFNQEWYRWHLSILPAFTPSLDTIYDLAPRTTGAWPLWTAIGDKKINIGDATAFTECCMSSTNATISYSNYVKTSSSATLIYVTVTSAPYGIYQANIVLPYRTYINTTKDPSGNLRYVIRGFGAGNLFYSEYDPVTRTIRITGNVKGNPPYSVAAFYYSK